MFITVFLSKKVCPAKTGHTKKPFWAERQFTLRFRQRFNQHSGVYLTYLQQQLHSDRLAEHCTPFQSPEYDSITVSIIKSESNIVNLEFFPISACQI